MDGGMAFIRAGWLSSADGMGFLRWRSNNNSNIYSNYYENKGVKAPSKTVVFTATIIRIKMLNHCISE